MNKLKIAVFALLMIVICTGCSIKKHSSDIIKINDTVITQKEFDKAFEDVATNGMFAQMGIDLKADPDNLFALMIREKVVSELIVKALLNDEMSKRKINVSKDELNDAEKEIVEKFGDKEQLLAVLKMNNVSYEDFKKDLKEEIKLKKYVESIAMVSIGESEAKKYYEENKDKFKLPKRVRASHILIAANPDQIKATIKAENKDISDKDLEEQLQTQMDERKAKAENIQKIVKKSPSTFAKVAKETSQDAASAIKGGDLGFFAKEEMVEPFASKAFAMAPNTISEVIQTPYGYHIIMVTDRAEAGTVSFEESKNDIINFLESQDKMEILQNKVESLKNEAKIEYYNDDYNPEVIQKKLKDEASENPEANNDSSESNAQ